MKNKLMYRTPAAAFSEALPIGNGAFGAMVYGGFPDFHYSLNLDTLWSGKPNRKDCFSVGDEIRQRVREQIKKEEYFTAQEMVQQYLTGQKYNESYLSAGFLDIHFRELEEQTDYCRELDMNTASVGTIYRSKGGAFKTESFVSCADDVLVTRVVGEAPATVEVGLSSLLRHEIVSRDGVLELSGEAPGHVEPNYVDSPEPILYGGGMKFMLRTSVFYTDGKVLTGKNTLCIESAKEIVLVTAGVTGFRGWDREMEAAADILQKECRAKFTAAAEFDYAGLLLRHEQVYQPLFQRVLFELRETEADEMPLDVRLKSIQQEKEDQGLYEILFQYGRYLMICSSLPGGNYRQPATLQGIWCEDIRPMWSCNWTININTEMNYWLTGPCALSECDEPLMQMIKEASIAGRSTAKELLGSTGWAVCHNLDLWRQTTPVKGMVKWSFWPMGGIWLATHLYRHYLYTGETEFLKKQAYPIMKGAAEFCIGWMYEEGGVLHSSPSTSPENNFLDRQGRVCAVSDSSTMDIALIKEILTETIDAAVILQQDPEYAAFLRAAVKKLPGYQLGRYGQIMEWSKDFTEEDPNHRHFAHLVGLHPFHQIDAAQNPELLAGAKTTIRRRLEGAKCRIGWDEAWLVNFCARLHQGHEAKEHLLNFLKYCAYPNLFSLHPPLGENDREREIFQIDGNFGITAGIAEMLLQSQPGRIDLLPALPDEWRQGKISGLKTAGGHTIEIAWRESRLFTAHLTFYTAEQITLRCKTAFTAAVSGGDRMVSTQKGDYYQLEIAGEKELTCHISRLFN